MRRITKPQQRILILIAALITLVGAAVRIYAIRMDQIASQTLQWRAAGLAAFDVGDNAIAANKLVRCLTRQPDDVEILYKYALARYKVEEPRSRHLIQARNTFHRVLELQPDHRWAKRKLLEVYVKLGYDTEAIEAANEILADVPHEAQALGAKAICLNRLGRLNEAFLQAKEYHEQRPMELAGLRLLLAIMTRLDRPSEEILLVAKKYSKRQPKDIDGQILTFSTMHKLGESEQDIISYATGLYELRSDELHYELVMAIAYKIVNDRPKAIEWSRKFVQRPAPDADIVIHVVNVMNGIGLFDESLAVLQRNALFMSDWRIHQALIQRLFETNQLAELTKELADLATNTWLFQTSVDAQISIGDPRNDSTSLVPNLTPVMTDPETISGLILRITRAFIAADEADRAQKTMAPLLSTSRSWRAAWMWLAAHTNINPKIAAQFLIMTSSAIPLDALDEQLILAKAWASLGSRAARPEHVRTARDILGHLVDQPEVAAGAVLVLALINDAQADNEAAERGYRRALALNSNLPVAQNNLAMIIVRRHGNMTEAAKLAAYAVKAAPANPTFWDTFACVKSESGQYDRAIANMQRAIQLDNENMTWRLNLAAIYLQADQLEQAKVVIDRIDSWKTNAKSMPKKEGRRLARLRQQLLGASAAKSMPTGRHGHEVTTF